MPAHGPRTRSFRYLLGDSRAETRRLAVQAKLWEPVSKAFFDRIGIRRGWKALEVGPGQGALHVELRRRVGGPVDAVERSAPFVAEIRAKCERDGRGEGRIWQCDLRDAKLPRARYDLIFARWVFLFLPDPMQHVRQLVRALRPGGYLAIQDYHRDTLTLVPRPAEWSDFLAADRKFFASQGGDASIGGKMPDLMRRAGLSVGPVVPTIKTGGPGTNEWEWATTYFRGVMKAMSAFRPLTPRKGARLLAHWRAIERRPSSLLIAPAVLDVLGRKPR